MRQENSKRIGQISKLTRYPVKSMAGVEMEHSDLGWHGLVGDRRFGVRQMKNASGLAWLTANRMPELLMYRPCDFDTDSGERLPTRVQSPAGDVFEIEGDKLRAEIRDQIGCDVEVMAMKDGIFDDSPISVIATQTVSTLCNEAGVAVDSRRFRANIVLNCDEVAPFLEDDWVGRVLMFGVGNSAPAVQITKRDVRCKMIGLNPDTAQHDPSVVKSAVKLNENNAGVYGDVIRTGTISIGDPVFVLDSNAG
ncbi:MOSC domain protein [Novipirellula galeiformis]|uniref:MOSC domain protein n=1 Tax=Novipirellula galeiformis TaxID=2528004 RepID=A0A5C6BF17_9BACT|nr:MOSC N-terminal beta barrel domain-containing protein [Novipirellula galeiformis]TWU10332.1 MOSC domain protein [Novipirellula galeiformis]